MTDHRPPEVDPDPLTVEPEPAARRPYQGWSLDEPAPIRHEFALIGFGVCLGIVIFALLFTLARSFDATPRSAPVIPPAGTSGEDAPTSAVGSSATPGGSGQGLTGAPLGPLSETVDPVDAVERRTIVAGGASASVGDPTSVPAPSPTGAIGTALIGGWATWYDACARCAAAGPALRSMLGPSWRGKVVTVEGPAGASVSVVLSDFCQCGDRHGMPTLLDLSRDAFAELAHPSAGIVAVSLELPAQLPSTDTEEEPDD